ncbi:MAG TPA: hypothetical protein PLU10_05590 [Chitinophagaceae bacterium]|nr:hypothetical protein [Chitinophagaceae bacterium]
MLKPLLFTICFLNGLNLFAQETKETNYQNNPVWIQMMEDPHANYFEAVNAFNLYWENREKPIVEDELFSANQEDKMKDNFIASKRSEKNESNQDFAFAYKKFKRWQITNASLIHEDGTLLTPEERIERWKLQHQQRH